MKLLAKVIRTLFNIIKYIFTNPSVIAFWGLVGVGVYFYVTRNTNNDKDNSDEEVIAITENMISDLKEIGEWEFYNISTEELIDTTIPGIIYDDKLTLIYKGTLRLGINFKEIENDWFYSPNRDSVFCLLPKVKLLDENFINETGTRVLHESGTIEPKVRAEITRRAYSRMKSRNLTASNFSKAQNAAKQGITQYLSNFGFKYIEIMWKE